MVADNISNDASPSNETDKPAQSVPPPVPTVSKLSPGDPIQWLRLGWRDLVESRFRAVFYGLLFVLMGYAISAVYVTRWQLTMGLIAGFFLVGPFLCTGIYELSRQMSRGEKPSLTGSILCWKRSPGAIGFFSLILTFAMIVWARVSLILFALFSTTSFPSLQSVLGAIFSFENFSFLAIWTVIGLAFATLVFAISVVSVPMMLDRGVDTLSAVFASVRCLQQNPKVLLLWAVLIVAIIGLSLLLGFIPLVITAPLIGHATWHSYKHCLGFDKPA